MGELLIFGSIAALMVLCSLMVVIGKNPVASAIFLVAQLFLLACLYALLGAHFVAAIQILVYAGAIMVLFVFVIMLLNLQPEALHRRGFAGGEIGVLLLTLVGFLVIGWKIAGGYAGGVNGNFTLENIELAGGNTYVVGMELFTKYLWPFELASILILMAIVASIVIAKRKSTSEP